MIFLLGKKKDFLQYQNLHFTKAFCVHLLKDFTSVLIIRKLKNDPSIITIIIHNAYKCSMYKKL